MAYSTTQFEVDNEGKVYVSTDKEQDVVKNVYEAYTDMWEDTMSVAYREFNDRTLQSFLDYSQKRANSYVPSRDSQNKEDWQANVFTGTTRDKLRSYVSSVSKEPPEIRVKAVNERREQSFMRGEVMKQLIRHSYITYDNPEETIFFDGWDCAVNGTVIKYDTYLYQRRKVKVVKNFDPITGKVEHEEEEAVVEDRPQELYIHPNRMFIRNAYIRDIQKQPDLIWIDYMDKGRFDAEFGKFKNVENVDLKRNSEDTRADSDLFFGEKWWDRTQGERIEVLRYYNKQEDKYCIIANGVLLLESPLLWGKRRKMYPFAKTLFEPFANSSLFWGNNLPNILIYHQDTENALWNSMLDKTYRTTQTPLLIGMANKDLMDLEDEIVTGDGKIYVNDVSQVMPVPLPQVNASVDAVQQGFSGSGSTAREIVIANEKANEIKGMFFLMLKDLWLQKTRLRLLNILEHYNRPIRQEQVAGKDAVEMFREFNVPTQTSDGGQGVLRVKFGSQEEIQNLSRPVGFQEEGKPFNRLDVMEEKAKLEEGQRVEIVVIPHDYLDNWEYEIEIMTESLFQKGKALDMALIAEKVTTIAKLFPDYFLANKEQFFADLMRQFNDNPDRYTLGAPQTGQSGMVAPQGGGEVMSQLASVAQSLPRLTGAEV